MEARETDKLFRDKLKHLTSAPKANSWERLETMLDEKEKAVGFIYWRIAAIGLLLVLSAVTLFLWNRNTVDSTQELANTIEETNDTLKPKETIAAESSEKYSEKEEVKPKEIVTDELIAHSTTKVREKKIENTVVRKDPDQEASVKQEETIPVEEEAFPVVSPLEELEVAEELSQPELLPQEPVKKKKRLPVKITYKRGNPAPAAKEDEMIARQKLDSTGGKTIKEFFAQTREIKPGDVWADLREAKHNLFQRKENNKKNNVKNLNK